MNPYQARDGVEKVFRQAFDEPRFLFFIRNLVNYLDEAKKQTWTLKKIDELVYALYGLTPEEIKLVESAAK
jgi:hypothetical protein